MPYITNNAKEVLNTAPQPRTVGELNYKFTMLAKDWIEGSTETYQAYNDVIGALECCKLELYRRKIALYEDKKIKENGDVY